ncbi:hypothetical protein J2D69_16010 [Lysinibacillus sphaericus]|jgi:hypothetical protein|uniref:Uncharacterized protein n=3 Tax=Lysinibacillus TaxID=400634 RepID=W7SAP8_LYSSH|nr:MULTISPECIES: hypothetical protein [Lysinibacillus]MBE5082948.1 hypothetical protein [Bacillus thuringiensis]ACA41264.1 hypothetical protein Bsph_3784 [Lysinibacillus sphaericus C3-41]EWH31115.1 hypothetical protein P799_21175 [Lysinibacillus sphaericus CBAM5]EWH33518.1 hypothetical protein P799_14145 [Lysinibacillus sphaericus CBAM5]MCS1397525.1 hypothetical protein [Lysinibacillus sp. PB211]
MKVIENTRLEKIKKALEKYGIYSEEQLKEAIKNMKPLNIGCMVSPVPPKKVLEGQEC